MFYIIKSIHKDPQLELNPYPSQRNSVYFFLFSFIIFFNVKWIFLILEQWQKNVFMNLFMVRWMRRYKFSLMDLKCIFVFRFKRILYHIFLVSTLKITDTVKNVTKKQNWLLIDWRQNVKKFWTKLMFFNSNKTEKITKISVCKYT